MTRTRHWAWLPCVLAAGPAYAHSPVPGFEGFYVGLIHPFSTPAQALVMLASALLVAGFATASGRWLFVGFLGSSLVGVAIGQRVQDPDPALFALAASCAALSALLPGRLGGVAMAGLVAAGGLIGQVSIPDAGPFSDRLITLSGSLVGANLGLLYLLGINHVIRERYTRPWVAIAFRVAAAWLGAIALVMLALGFADVPPPGA